MLEVRGLSVALPGGVPVVADLALSIAAGTVVSLLGPSGAGKSTLVKALLDPEAMRRQGFGVTYRDRTLSAEPAYVPQRGALIDHLDVAGNIELAQRAGGKPQDALPWLTAVELDVNLAHRSVATLSGGQAQRLAVARALAAGRRLLVLDEPSVGLDPLAVRQLARLLVDQAREQQAAVLIITHDLSLAAGASDQILYLDPTARTLSKPMPWLGPVEHIDEQARRSRLGELESAVERLLAVRSAAPSGGRARRRIEWFATLRVAGAALLRSFDPRLFVPSLRVMLLGFMQALVRPVLFYAIVALLLGITVPYVVVHISTAVRPAAMLGMIGGSYILALAPPLSAIVFSATSGSAVNAWLGGLRLRGQIVALEGLGVPPSRYLYSPVWLALLFSYLVTAAVFVAAMIAGGYLLFDHYAVPDAFAKLSADFLDPAPERESYLWRGIWLVFAYALTMASVVVAKGREPKQRADQVTQAMTSGVMRTTLLVVILELGSIAWLYSGQNP